MARQHHLSPEFPRPDDGRIKILYLKPQQHTIAMSQFRIPDGPVMVLNVPVVQLHNQLAVGDQLFVMAPTMAALTSQQPLVPATARLNISDTNKRLWTHIA